MRFALIVAGGLLGLGTQTAFAADITQIACTGRTNDGQTVKVSVQLKAMPEPSSFSIQLGTQETAEHFESPLEISSEPSDVQSQTISMYRARLSPTRSFAARTTDLKAGRGMIQISAAVRAPLMSCVFN